MFNMDNIKIFNENDIKSFSSYFSYKDLLNVYTLYDKGITGKNLVCSIIDTGCDFNHPMLKDKIIGGRNFTNEGRNENDFYDLNGHGTHVAGLVSSDPCGVFNGGIAPDSKLLICKALDRNGSGDFYEIINAINYSIDNNVNVINMSLGGPVDLPQLYQAVKRAHDKGIIICCASGNEAYGDGGHIDEHCYPGAYQEVIEVGAINKNKIPSYFSNSNNMVDCVCYGEDILSTFLNNSYVSLSGTSQATPLVAGSVLLLKEWFMREFNRMPSSDEIYATLIKCSKSMNNYNKKQVGFGYIDFKELED